PDDRDQKPQDSDDLAEDRTDWAEDRTVLANERTFAGWMRTGMASLGLALGMEAVFGEFEPTWVPKAVTTIFVVTAVFVFLASAIANARAQKRLDSHDAEQTRPRQMWLLAVLLSAGAVGVGGVLWLL